MDEHNNIASNEEVADNEDFEELDVESTLENTEGVLNALIDVLIEKNVLTEEELQKKLDEDAPLESDE